MSKAFKLATAWLLLFSCAFQAAAYSTQFADAGETLRLHWNQRVIPIAFSTSLKEQNFSIRPGSDVADAIQNSLAAWERAADVRFQVAWTDKTTVSPAGKAGDGTSLVTVAQTGENLQMFGGEAETISARTRIFYNRKGLITEADIVLNPYEQFSTDGGFGTFDLEATLTHEIGHLLGLEHSSVIGATMHEHQGRNGVYNLASFGARTLAEDDIAGVRALYGAPPEDEADCCGSVAGKITQANGKPAVNFQVWAEDAASGRVAAGVTSNAEGNYLLEGLSPGQYKLYARDYGKNGARSFSVEELGEATVGVGKTPLLSKKLKTETKNFDVRYVGFNGQVSELAVPINAGKTYTIYVGGKNLDAEKVAIGFNSPYLKVNPLSLTNLRYGDDVSVISFEIAVAARAPLGEYSFFVKAKNKNTEFAVGSLTVENFPNAWSNFAESTNE